MTYFYIDMENVGAAAIQHILHADPKDSKFFIYYSAKFASMKWEFTIQLLKAYEKGHRFGFVKCPNGNQSVDKHIIADLAICAGKCPTRDYVIISNDKGYGPVTDLISERTHANVQVYRGDYVYDTEEEDDDEL